MTATDSHAAAFFCQSVARLLAPPGAEDDAVRHLRAEDLPDLLVHLRERLAQARTEGEAAGAARERVAVAWHFNRIAAGLRAEADASQSESYRLWAYPRAQEAENVERIVMRGEHVAPAAG